MTQLGEILPDVSQELTYCAFVNIMGADVLATQGAIIILTLLNRNI